MGLEGSGKTTFGEYLVPNSEPEYIFIDPEIYLKNLFRESFEKFLELIYKFIDPDFKFKSKVMIQKSDFGKKKILIGLSEQLKIIASCIFELESSLESYLIFEGTVYRNLRETVQTIYYKIPGKLTARQALQYLGTDVFRKNWSENIWIDLLIKNLNPEAELIIIPDVRFENEYQVLKKAGAKIILIYRSELDLNPVQHQNKHISSWGFLNFIQPDDLRILNSGSILEFYQKIDELMAKLI